MHIEFDSSDEELSLEEITPKSVVPIKIEHSIFEITKLAKNRKDESLIETRIAIQANFSPIDWQSKIQRRDRAVTDAGLDEMICVLFTRIH